jgi:thiamine biosynthesis lipoprotein
LKGRGVRATVAVLVFLAPAATARGECVREGRPAMGTLLQLQLCGGDAEALRSSARMAFDEVGREEAIFSSHREESAVSRLSRRAGQGATAVPSDLHRILHEARRYGELTRGTFDVTVGPLVELWRTVPRAPSRRSIEAARARTGLAQVALGPDGTAGLARPGMSVDLGGIAKGYALDRVREMLADRPGFASGLLEFGASSVWAIGAPPDAPAWNVVLRAPEGDPLALLALRDQALSVSASFGSFREMGGRRYGHVIDPRSGRALERELVGAVVAADATGAEALSKALLVLAEEGIALIEALPAAEAVLFEPGRPPLRTSGWDGAVGVRRFASDEDASLAP